MPQNAEKKFSGLLV